MMATTEERMKILKMIDEGKISAEEGAKLLSALSDKPEPRNDQLRTQPRNGECPLAARQSHGCRLRTFEGDRANSRWACWMPG